MRGFEGDRVLQVADNKNKFCTPRDADKRKLFHIQCQLNGPGLTKLTLWLRGGEVQPLRLDLGDTTGSREVTVQGGDTKVLQDYGDKAAAWLATTTGIEGCRLTGIGAGYERTVALCDEQNEPVPEEQAPLSLADEGPYLLASRASLTDLNSRLAARGEPAVDMRRFRPNIVIRGASAWEEDSWRKIRIGKVEFWVWQRCGRCIMTTIDRETLKVSVEPLRSLSAFRARPKGSAVRNFGMHLVPVHGLPAEGIDLAEGDQVEVLEYRGFWERYFT